MSTSQVIVKQWSEAEKAWLACAIDSEGSVNFRPDQRHPHTMYLAVWFCNTNRQFAERFAELSGGRLYQRPPRGFGKKIQFEVYVTSKERVGRVLEAILPFLIVKRDRALKVLEWIKAHPDGRAGHMSFLNRTLSRDSHGSNAANS